MHFLRRVAIPALVFVAVCVAPLPARADSGESVVANRVAASQLAVGSLHACVIVEKNVYCWGDNATGQLGTFDVTSSSTPLRVGGITTATAVSAGYGHTCALLEDKTVWCWGTNAQKQLGFALGSSSATPRQVAGLSNVTSIAMGSGFGCALIGLPGGVMCWGENGSAPQLGRATTSGDADPSPGSVLDLTSNVQSLAIGDRFGCAVLVNGTAKCWGDNTSGQLGTQNTVSPDLTSPNPVVVVGVTGITAMSAGSNHTCAVIAEGKMKCWGSAFEGQLGANVDINDLPNVGFGLLPLDVVSGRGSTSLFTGAVAVSAGSSFSCAVRSTGTAACWGLTVGTGGMGAYITAPVSLVGVTQAVAVSAGSNFACALLSDGGVNCWGEGGRGQLGNSSTNNSGNPVAITGVVAQTISFGALTGKSLGDASFSLSATATSGAAVSFASSTTSVCTVSAAAVTIVGAGTCTIVASRGASSIYAAATSVTQSFTVSGGKPVVATGTATTQSIKATLRGTVNPGGVDTSVVFIHGKDPKLVGASSTAAVTKSGTTSEEVSTVLSDLSTNTTYYYRIEATNTLGKSVGDIVSFTTKRPEGVTINDEDEFTKSTKVTVSVVGPTTAVSALVSNDGSFRTTKTFDLVDGAADIPWTLLATRDGSYTKVVYVRFQSKFGTKLSDSTDDIIVDTSKPILNSASAKASSALSGAVTIAAAKSGGVKITIKARDSISGAGFVEVRSAANKKSSVIAFKKSPTKVKVMGMARLTSDTVSVNTTAKRVQIRVLDKAGNASGWSWLTVRK
jgi:alpha-tubulin suppressor-like RCC1 family protein